MEHARCMLDKQGYTPTRPGTPQHTHTHTQKYEILIVLHQWFRERAPVSRYRTLPVLSFFASASTQIKPSLTHHYNCFSSWHLSLNSNPSWSYWTSFWSSEKQNSKPAVSKCLLDSDHYLKSVEID